MKKIIPLIILAMVFCVTSCGENVNFSLGRYTKESITIYFFEDGSFSISGSYWVDIHTVGYADVGEYDIKDGKIYTYSDTSKTDNAYIFEIIDEKSIKLVENNKSDNDSDTPLQEGYVYSLED